MNRFGSMLLVAGLAVSFAGSPMVAQNVIAAEKAKKVTVSLKVPNMT